MFNESAITVGALLLSGGAGALTKEILGENSLQLPKLFNGKIFLGFIGSIFVGAAVGLIVDHSPLTAFFAGYTGFSAAGALLSSKIPTLAEAATAATLPAAPTAGSITELITKIATENGVDPKLAIAVAKCESGLKPKARNVNKTGTVDRGLYQINNYWHPEVTDEQADDPEFAIKFFCNAAKAGHLSWWEASKKCWGFAQKV